MRRQAGSRGTGVVETVAVVGVLIALLLGIIELGYAWRQASAVEKTVQQAGRVAASVADQPLADYEALQTFRSVLESSDSVELDYLVIYRSTTADGAVPDNCRTASVDDVCNRYTASDLTRSEDDFGSCTFPDPDRFWCPMDRDRERAPRPDYVGLHAQLTYTTITDAFPATLSIGRSSVYAVEPCAFGLPGC